MVGLSARVVQKPFDLKLALSLRGIFVEDGFAKGGTTEYLVSTGQGAFFGYVYVITCDLSNVVLFLYFFRADKLNVNSELVMYVYKIALLSVGSFQC